MSPPSVIVDDDLYLLSLSTGKFGDEHTMELSHVILNLIAPPITALTFFFFLPPYLLFKLLLSNFKRLENVAGKVVIITGASSGIGEHLAYEYARRGACLALVARREKRLHNVAGKSLQLGSPEVIVVQADVTKVEDCKRLVDETVNHFGRIDHLVNNAGVATVCLFEECTTTNLATTMDTNFWGSVYCTYFAIPHLKLSKGKIIGVASSCAWVPVVRMSIYRAAKAAVISFYETIMMELGTEIGITIVFPGLIDSEMTQGKFLSKEGLMIVDEEMRDVQEGLMPVESASECAKVIVDSACRGDKNLTMPSWMGTSFFWNMFLPEIVEWGNQFLWRPRPGKSQRDAASRSILNLMQRFTGHM